MVDERGWLERRACRGYPPALWYPVNGGKSKGLEIARAVCAGCPVQGPCGAYGEAVGERLGLWAGKTETDRRAARKAGKAKAKTRKPPPGGTGG